MVRRYYRLAFVNILSNVTVPLVGLVDTAMLGHLDDIRFLAGVALASVLFDYVYWTFGFLRMGTTGLTAQAFGRRDDDAVFLTLYRSTLIAVAVAAALLLFQAWIADLGFRLLGGEHGVEQAGRSYFQARIWGAPATLCNFVLVGWLLGRAQSGHVLTMTVVANVANVVLNYVFIMQLQLAAFGAGLASMVSQYLMLGVGGWIVLAKSGRPAWSWAQILQRGRFGELFRLNRDILIRTFFLVSAFSLFTAFSSRLDTLVLAANSILLRVLAVASFLIDGAAFATESLAGIFVGQRDVPKLRRLVRLSLGTGLGFAVLVLAGFMAWPEGFLQLMTSHSSVIELGRTYAPWLIPTLLFGSLAYMLDGLFLGMTEGRILRNAMTLCMLAVFLPVALLALAWGSNHLLWAAMATFMVARSLSLGWATRGRLALPGGPIGQGTPPFRPGL